MAFGLNVHWLLAWWKSVKRRRLKYGTLRKSSRGNKIWMHPRLKKLAKNKALAKLRALVLKNKLKRM